MVTKPQSMGHVNGFARCPGHDDVHLANGAALLADEVAGSVVALFEEITELAQLLRVEAPEHRKASQEGGGRRAAGHGAA